jgi:erythromycin esterase-like protein
LFSYDIVDNKPLMDYTETASRIAAQARTLSENSAGVAPLLQLLEVPLVLLGESTHGTREFYAVCPAIGRI